MIKLFKSFSILAALALFIAVFGAQVVQAQPENQAAPNAVTYQAVLGKSLRDQGVADFLASNNCAQTDSLYLCRPAGLALWTDDNQIVKTVYLYLKSSADFAAYKGELPLGLVSSDTIADVEQKLGQPKVGHALQAGWEPGLPDYGFVPDHIHYWAVYKRFGVTVIYNSPSVEDKSATIYALLVSK